MRMQLAWFVSMFLSFTHFIRKNTTTCAHTIGTTNYKAGHASSTLDCPIRIRQSLINLNIKQLHMNAPHSAATNTHIISRLFILCLASISFSPFFLLSAQSIPNTINMTPQTNNISTIPEGPVAGELEKLKQEEAHLGKYGTLSEKLWPLFRNFWLTSLPSLISLPESRNDAASLLANLRQKKLNVLRSRPLTIGIIGFGRFGQFIAKSFTKYGDVIGTSRSDYTAIANDMGAKYIPLSDLERFVMEENLDVIVVAVSIVSFEDTIKDLVPLLKKRMEVMGARSCPLIVDVLSVKEHPRNIFLDLLPEECDILCTHPMFGPDSAKHGWQGQTFVYERTRIDKVLLDPSKDRTFHHKLDYESDGDDSRRTSFYDVSGLSHGVHENSESSLNIGLFHFLMK